LFDNFFAAKISFPALRTARAELAAVSAADLRGNAQCVAIADLAVERRVRGNEDAFDKGMVREAPKKFLGGVAGTLLANQFQRLQRVMAPQFFPQRLGQIRHRLPTRHAMNVKPFQNLRDAVSRFAPRFKLRFQFFFGLRFDIEGHGDKVALF
jgi:hypothetical protein